MSARQSCAAFFVPMASNSSVEMFRSDVLDRLNIADPDLTEYGQTEWGGLICEIRVRPFRSFWMLGIIFSYRSLRDLIENAHAQASQGKETPDSVRQFVTEFARACDILQPELALVEFIPLSDILEFTEGDVQDRIEKTDVDYFTENDHPLLYFGESLADKVEDWRLDRPRDEVPMGKGRLFYYGAGPYRWELLEPLD